MILLILLFWLILSNQLSSFFLIAALISSLLVTFINKKIFFPLEFKLKFTLILSILRLVKAMLDSTYSVVRIIWLNKPIKTSIKWEKIPQSNIIDQVFIANAITLTPGTMSMGLKDNKILIHAIKEIK